MSCNYGINSKQIHHISEIQLNVLWAIHLCSHIGICLTAFWMVCSHNCLATSSAATPTPLTFRTTVKVTASCSSPSFPVHSFEIILTPSVHISHVPKKALHSKQKHHVWWAFAVLYSPSILYPSTFNIKDNYVQKTSDSQPLCTICAHEQMCLPSSSALIN